jgi:hypothetical protein
VITDVRLTAAILAIGTFVALGVLAFLGWTFWRERRRRQREAQMQALLDQAAANARALRTLQAEFQARRLPRD